MFYGCPKLTYIDISDFSFPSNFTFSLFDTNIPSVGTIIVKDENVQNQIDNLIPNWKIIVKS